MNHVAAQATAYETISEGHPERVTTYSVLMNKDEGTSDRKREEHLQKLCKEADQAWVDTNAVVFDHQLHYDARLAGFIISAEKRLQEKHNQVWDCIQGLTDAAPVPQDI